MAAEEVEKLENKSPGPSLTVPSVSQSFHDDQDAPLLSIDYIHNSLANANMNSLANHFKKQNYGTSYQDNGVTKLLPDGRNADEEKSSSMSTPKHASIPSSVFNLCNTIIGAGILSM